jgi:fluoride exporter
MLVALGSALGGVARFGVSTLGVRWLGPAFPWGTLAVNVLGSAFIGWLSAALPLQPPSARLFLMTGVCGGFTTFSAFSLETFELIRQGDSGRAAIYTVASLMLCGLAVLGGAWLGRGR